MTSRNFSKVLITGTTSGLGKALHEYYAKIGIPVIEVNRRASKEDSEIPVLHSEVLDITNSGEVYTFLSHLRNEELLPDLFILNAGINIPDCLTHFDYTTFSKVMNTNLHGVLTFISAIHRLGLKNCTIATISSTSNIVPNPGNIAYHLSKLNLKIVTELLGSQDPFNTYKTVVLSPVHTNIQLQSPPSPGINSFLFNLLAVPSSKAASACARFFSGRATVFYYTKPACVFYYIVRLALVFFPFLYRGSSSPQQTSTPLTVEP